MKYLYWMVLFIISLPAQAADYKCSVGGGEVIISSTPCAKGNTIPEENSNRPQISSRAQAVQRAEAIKAKRDAVAHDKALNSTKKPAATK